VLETEDRLFRQVTRALEHTMLSRSTWQVHGVVRSGIQQPVAAAIASSIIERAQRSRAAHSPFGHCRSGTIQLVLPLHPGMELDVREHAFLLSSHQIANSFRPHQGLANILFGGKACTWTFVTTSTPGLLILHVTGTFSSAGSDKAKEIMVDPEPSSTGFLQ